MSILNYFPPGFTPRQIQVDLIKKIEDAFNSGYQNVILSAPTGIGKSYIGGTFALFNESSNLITATKTLQDQYSKDLQFLKSVKGKSNFVCLDLMKRKKIDLTDKAKAVEKNLTCNYGKCEKTKVVNGKKIKKICEFKPLLSNMQSQNNSFTCDYYVQKYDGLKNKHTVWNYASYFQLLKYQMDVYSVYFKRKIGIFDEAHKIENEIISFIGIDIDKNDFKVCQIEINNRNLQDIDVIINILDSLADSYSRKINYLENSIAFQNNPNYEYLVKLEDKYKKFFNSKIDISSNKDNFIINDPIFENGEFSSISIKPLDVSKYAHEFFNNSKQIFMSATIDKSSFCENYGFKPDKVEIIDTPKSPFSIQNRRVCFLNVRSLSINSSEQDEQSVIREIDQILTKHNNVRGLILTSSKQRCIKIKENLSVLNEKRIRLCHSTNDNGKTQNQIVDDHSKDPTGVLLSSSLWEGIDLKDELSRFQIIAKTPYQDLSEKRVKEKKDRYPLWYNSQAITKLLQGFGRSIRSENDWANTYVLDSNAHNLLKNNIELVPAAYHDLLN